MKNKTNPFSTLAYKQLRDSDEGKTLVTQSEADAAIFLFDLESGVLNADVVEYMSAHKIYTAVTLASSLAFEVEGKTYTVDPYFDVNEETALAILQDVQSTIENSLLLSHLDKKQNSSEYLPGAAKQEIIDVCMLDVVDQYDTPDEVPEWEWIEKNSCYEHSKNGQCGIWEFVLNLSVDLSGIPDKLKSVIDTAKKQHCAYILFHQGT
ncbi:MAG: hypothetical protein JKX76_15530 [Colwellia sp.]|nr:hypothetical protein [Colwellia sp.]